MPFGAMCACSRDVLKRNGAMGKGSSRETVVFAVVSEIAGSVLRLKSWLCVSHSV